jgi:hypothetical protein
LDINMHFIEQNIHVLCNMMSYECYLMKIVINFIYISAARGTPSRKKLKRCFTLKYN